MKSFASYPVPTLEPYAMAEVLAVHQGVESVKGKGAVEDKMFIQKHIDELAIFSPIYDVLYLMPS